MKMHDLKCWPVYFCAIKAGIKAFDVRKDDRGYQCGDVLNLREWDPQLRANQVPGSPEGFNGYTGDSVVAVVTYLLPLDEVPDLAAALDAPDGAWVVLGIRVVGA